jgi:hypothetical protein
MEDRRWCDDILKSSNVVLKNERKEKININ